MALYFLKQRKIFLFNPDQKILILRTSTFCTQIILQFDSNIRIHVQSGVAPQPYLRMLTSQESSSMNKYSREVRSAKSALSLILKGRRNRGFLEKPKRSSHVYKINIFSWSGPKSLLFLSFKRDVGIGESLKNLGG